MFLAASDPVRERFSNAASDARLEQVLDSWSARTRAEAAAHRSCHAAPTTARRALLTGRISEALFGLDRPDAPAAQRLQALCAGVVELMAEPDQHITLLAELQGEIPDRQIGRALRLVHELVGHAVTHGMHMRLLGRIRVTMAGTPAGVAVTVTDDGWSAASRSCAEGMHLARALAAAAGGTLVLERAGDETIARASLPAIAA